MSLDPLYVILGEVSVFWSPNYTIQKLNLRWMKDFKSWHHKTFQENIGRKISNIPHSNIFTDMSARARDINEKINKWDLIKIKSFCMSKENSIKMKREPTIWENIVANDTSNRCTLAFFPFHLISLYGHSQFFSSSVTMSSHLALSHSLCSWCILDPPCPSESVQILCYLHGPIDNLPLLGNLPSYCFHNSPNQYSLRVLCISYCARQ